MAKWLSVGYTCGGAVTICEMKRDVNRAGPVDTKKVRYTILYVICGGFKRVGTRFYTFFLENSYQLSNQQNVRI